MTIDQAAAAVGARYGMTASQVLQHIAIGETAHPDAAGHECGATHPTNPGWWCGRSEGHSGDHYPRWRRQDWYEEDLAAGLYGLEGPP